MTRVNHYFYNLKSMYFGEYYFALVVYSYRTFEENVRPKDPSKNRVFEDSRD